ncbi:hypothetical protein K435DRAFT_562346, partial [Dendrothele bispora CBS 962.96]
VDRLVKNVLQKDDFDVGHLDRFRAEKEAERLDDVRSSGDAIFSSHVWGEDSVTILLPKSDWSWSEETQATLEVKDVQRRSFVEVIRTAYQDTQFLRFSLAGFREFWKPTRESTSDRLYDESSDPSSSSGSTPSDYPSYEHPKPYPRPLDISANPIPWLMVPIMIYSDSTCVNMFGNTSMWPVYIFFLGLSKYVRSQPSSGAAHHFAYILSLPNIQEIYRTHFGEAATSEVLTHLKRELMQAIWFLLLDDELVNACIKGMVVLCADGVWRRLFPRIFIYSADYPEKMLLACLKTLGRCPCLRCEVLKSNIHLIGTARDMNTRTRKARINAHPLRWNVNEARRRMFEKGKAVNSKTLFWKINSAYNYFDLFVVDLLHEFELGVFKAVFTHLIRISYSFGDDSVAEINRR